MTNILTTLLLTLVLLSCTNNDKQETTSSTKDTTTVVTANNNEDRQSVDGPYRIGKDSITILPFEIEVVLTPKAKEKITKSNETIIVDVFLRGTPRDNAGAKLEEDGSFFVASAEKEIIYGQVAKFDGITFPRSIYDQLADKDVELTVNVYTGRKSSPNNLIVSDDLLFDKVSNVVNKKHTVKCKLIYGDD